MFYVWIAVLAAMFLLGGALAGGLIRGTVLERRRFDQSLLRYDGRHAATQPREPDTCRFPDCIIESTDSCSDVYPRLHCAEYTRTSDPWATILRPPVPGRDPEPATIQFRALTDTGAMRALKTETDTFLADLLREPEA